MKKRIFALLLCLIMVAGLMPEGQIFAAKKAKLQAPEFTITTTSKGNAHFTWTPVEGANGYRIYRMLPGEESHTRIITTTKSAATDKIYGTVAEKTKVSYKMRAFRTDEDGVRHWSSFSEAVTWKVPVIKPELSQSEAELMVGENLKLKVKKAKSSVVWSSTDSKVAKVSSSGKVLALKKGTCTIKASVDGYTLKCKVTVNVPAAGERYIDPTKPIIALSFDDGPSIYTPKILDMLAQYGATATFFMVGYNIDRYPKTVQAVYDAGCEIGNHTIDHPNLKTLSEENIKKQINGNLKKITDIVGEGKHLIRPPYGNLNDTVKAVAGAPLIIWSDDTRDWESRNAQSVLAEVKKSARDGYIILMHDIYESSMNGAALVVPWLIEQGYQVCSVSEMFAARGVKLEDGVRYSQCITAAQYVAQFEE